MARNALVEARMSRSGMRSLKSEEAHGALARLLRLGVSRAVVLDADWERMGNALGSAFPPLLSDVLVHRAGPVGESALLRQLQQTPEAERLSVLSAFLQHELRQVLSLGELPPPEAGFFDLGMDSLMAVELRNQLQGQVGEATELSPDLAFDHPSIKELAAYMAEKVGPLVEASKAVEQGSSVVATTAIAHSERRLPLSTGQTDLWLLHKTDRTSIANNIFTAVRIDGVFELRVASETLSHLVHRYPKLRATFHETANGPVQEVQDQITGWLHYHSIAGDTEPVKARFTRWVHEPFDLEAGPAFRIYVVTAGPDRNYLLLVTHRIVLDGFFLNLFFREWVELYQAATRRER